MKKSIPWWLKILIKIVLSRIPVSYRTWEKIGLFQHGYMEDGSYALQVFEQHYQRTGLTRGKEFTGLELGPGDSVISALIARGYGATKTYLVDTGSYAVIDSATYKKLLHSLNNKGLEIEDFPDDCSFSEMLNHYGGNYLINGLESLKSIPDQCIDFTWSQAVLEHIRLNEFDQSMQELYRILKQDGVSSHRIDLKDHLAYGLNNLRFSERIWESEMMAKSGFYTNRIRFSDMIQRFERTGFSVEIVNIDRWQKLPVPREKMSPVFSELPEEELLISGFDVILRKVVS